MSRSEPAVGARPDAAADPGPAAGDQRRAARPPSGVAMVLAGAGSRGAYEAGVCSVVLPALADNGQRPSIFVGTSAGAINAVAFASLSHLDAHAAARQVLTLWRSIHATDVFRPPLAAGLAWLAGWPARVAHRRPHPAGLLDPAPLAATLARLVDWRRLHDNLHMGRVGAVGVVATACSTGRSTVFVGRPPGVPVPGTNTGRGIDYRRAALHAGHVLASAAIPVVFPAVEIECPAHGRDWYLDGGVRLNTPIKPALALGAGQVVVVATSPDTSPASAADSHHRPAPGLAAGATQLLHATLADRMVEDLHTLTKKNEQAARARLAGTNGKADVPPGDREIPWLFAGPPATAGGDGLGDVVTEVLDGSAGPRPPQDRLAARLAKRDPSLAELLSYFFFDPGFIDQAIKLGQRHGRASLDAHRVPLWQPTTSQAEPAPS